MKTVLSIAGSDSSGGAGIQADLKTFEAFGVFGTTALTALTAQNTTGVYAVHPLPAEFVARQLDAIQSDFTLSAVKIGMLLNRDIIRTVKTFLESLDVPVVLDPVCVSKAGSNLLEDDALEAMRSLFEHATLVTPNQHEAARLFGYAFGDTDSLAGILSAPCPVLVKNQRLEHPDGTLSVDQLYRHRSRRIFTSPYARTRNTHGTGCSFSSAIAANLALGFELDEAIERSKRFISEAIAQAPGLGKGHGPIHHKKGGDLVT